MINESEELVHHAFGAYLDFVIEELVEGGISGDSAIELVFETAETLFENAALPAFPDDGAAWIDKARWLVAAKELDFRAFVQEVVADG